MSYTGTDGKEIYRWKFQDQPLHKEHMRIAVNKDPGKENNSWIDIREWLDIQDDPRGRNFTGFTKKGVRLYRNQVVDLMKQMPKIQKMLGIEDFEIEGEESDAEEKESE